MAIAAVISIFSGYYYWIGNMSGYQYPETLARVHFWLFFIGVNILFFPQHFLGLAGMPRRYADYPDAFAGWNYISYLGTLCRFARSRDITVQRLFNKFRNFHLAARIYRIVSRK